MAVQPSVYLTISGTMPAAVEELMPPETDRFNGSRGPRTVVNGDTVDPEGDTPAMLGHVVVPRVWSSIPLPKHALKV